LSLGSEPKHNLLNYTEQDERASSTQSLGSDLEYGTRTGSKVKISPVSLVSSIGSHSGSKTAALQATSGNRTHEDPSSTRATFPTKVSTIRLDRTRADQPQVRRGLENGSIVPGDLKLPRRRPYFSDEEKQAAIRESFDGEIFRAHDVTAELRAPRDAAQKATGKMSGKARKGELEGESLERVSRTVTDLIRPELNRIVTSEYPWSGKCPRFRGGAGRIQTSESISTLPR
jgi:transposase-like protein